MEEFIGSGLVLLCGLLLRGYVLENPILASAQANEVVATMMSLSLFGVTLLLMFSE